jgi:uncharacterized protein YjcR
MNAGGQMTYNSVTGAAFAAQQDAHREALRLRAQSAMAEIKDIECEIAEIDACIAQLNLKRDKAVLRRDTVLAELKAAAPPEATAL